MIEEAKKLISEAKNICIIPSQTNEPESLSAALALFYTLKESGKNVNLINEDFPQKLSFLLPSLDFLSAPKDFVIAIPRATADISQIYYEKSEEYLKIHLSTEHGHLKKDQISFYFENPKPDLVIVLGVQDFQKELAQKLDSFGFILNVPILNIDNNPFNKKFGQVNILQETSLAQILMEILGEEAVKKDLPTGQVGTATCLLAGMVMYYENFKTNNTGPHVLKIAAQLMEKGANYQQITHHLYATTPKQMDFLADIFKNVKNENGVYVAQLPSEQFWDFGEAEASTAMEKIKGLALQNNLLVLWQSHASEPMVKGFFYSTNREALHKVHGTLKNGWVFISVVGSDVGMAKNTLLNLIA